MFDGKDTRQSPIKLRLVLKSVLFFSIRGHIVARSLCHCCISATLYQYECKLNVLTMLLYSNCHNYA